MRRPLAFLCAVSIGIAGCTSAPGTVSVDSSFQVIDQQIQSPAGPVRLVAFLKARPAGGRLAVCGVFLVDEGGDAVLDELGNNLPYVQVGDTAARVGTRFFPRYLADLNGRPLAQIVPSPARCGITAVQWRPEFASARLILRLVAGTAGPADGRASPNHPTTDRGGARHGASACAGCILRQR